MTMVSFSDSPEDTRSMLSTLKDGGSRGPLAVSAWKQGSGGSEITFSVYSIHGSGSQGTKGDRAGPNYEISDGDLIHMVAPGNMALYIDNVQGAATDDIKQLFFEVDYGERWDAQFLTHSHLPAGFTTPAPDGATMGLYPGYCSGHAMRGTDMKGNQILTETYAGDGGAEGTKDNTVTVTVSDGVNSASMSFTVRLIHPLKYYAVGGANYPVGYNGTRAQQRLGVIYVSRDGDFTGCPTGPNIYHHTIPSGVIRKSGMFRFWSNGADREADEVITDTSDGSTLQDYPFVGNDPSAAIYFKAGEIYVGADELSLETFNGANCLVSSWGTANNGRAIISGEARQTWGVNPLAFMASNAVGDYRGLRFQNIHFLMSDYDVSDETWRVWWNIIKYSNKSGTFTENTNGSLNGSTYNGEFLQNAGGTVQTQIIRDVDNGDGTGEFWCRHVLDASVGYNGSTDFDPAKVFVDGETLTGQTNLGTVTFVASGSRQDRPNKTPPKCIDLSAGSDNGGEVGCLFDACIIQGAEVALSYPGGWTILSDTLIRDYWNYGIFGFTHCHFQSALVTAQPSNHPGQVRYFDSGNNSNKFTFNSVIGGTDPTKPTYNNISHCIMRIAGQQVIGQHKVGCHGYGGHTDGIDTNGDFVEWGGNHQPLYRWGNGGDAYDVWVYQYGCFFSGGASCQNLYTDWPVTRPALSWVMDTCHFRGDATNSKILDILHSNVAIKYCTIGWSSGVILDARARDRMAGTDPIFVEFSDFSGQSEDNATDLPDTEDATFFESCTFKFHASGTDAASTDVVWDRDHRDRIIIYTNCTTDIDEMLFASVEAL